MKKLLPSAFLIGLFTAGSLSALAQQYINPYVLGDSDYSCSNNSFIKDSLKKHDEGSAAIGAFNEGMCNLDGQKGNYKTKKQDIPKAMDYFQKAIGWNGGGRHPGYIGWRFLGQGTPDVPPNREMAEHWLHYAAKEQQDSAAYYNLGAAYLKGDVLPQDNKLAVENLTEAVKRQEPNATSVLAKLYREGKIVSQNLELADQLSRMEPEFAEQTAKRFRQEQDSSENLERTLLQIRADSHAAMMNILTQGISDLATQAATPNAITVATNQQVSNINATAANVQAAQAQAAQQRAAQERAQAQEKLNQALSREATRSQGSGSTIQPVSSGRLLAKQSGDGSSYNGPSNMTALIGQGEPTASISQPSPKYGEDMIRCISLVGRRPGDGGTWTTFRNGCQQALNIAIVYLGRGGAQDIGPGLEREVWGVETPHPAACLHGYIPVEYGGTASVKYEDIRYSCLHTGQF
jgi:hypothetical protein